MSSSIFVKDFVPGVTSLALTVVFTAVAIPYAIVTLILSVIEWLVDEFLPQAE